MIQLYKISSKWFFKGIPVFLFLCTVTWKTVGYAASRSFFGTPLTFNDTLPKKQKTAGSKQVSDSSKQLAVGSGEDSVLSGATRNPQPETRNPKPETNFKRAPTLLGR